MRGHLRQRSKGSYELRVFLADTRRVKTRTFRGNKKDAEKALTEWVAAIQAEGYQQPTKETVRAFLDRWLTDRAASREPNTVKNYRWVIDGHVAPVLGNVPLRTLQPRHVQDLVKEMRATAAGAKTVQYAYVVLRAALNDAVKWQLIPRNPCDAVDAPQYRRRQAPMPAPKTARAFLQAVAAEPLWGDIILVSIYTGMRRGEALGLQWPAVYPDEGFLSLVRQLKLENGRPVLRDLKTENSRRRIDLDPLVVRMLKARHVRSLEERLRLGPFYEDHQLVFSRADGRPLHPDSFTHALKRTALKAGLPKDTRLHDLRHWHATLLLASGVPVKVVSERLGHARTSITQDTYIHVIPGMQSEAVAKFGRLMESPEAGSPGV